MTHHPAAHRIRAGPPTTAPRAFGVLALVLAGLLVLNTLLGPVVAGRHRLRHLAVAAQPAPRPRGGDRAAGRAGHRVGRAVVPARPDAGPVLVIGPAATRRTCSCSTSSARSTAPTPSRSCSTWRSSRSPGALALWAWSLSARPPLPATSTAPARPRGSCCSASRCSSWRATSARSPARSTGAAIAAEFADARTFYWSIFLMDLGSSSRPPSWQPSPRCGGHQPGDAASRGRRVVRAGAPVGREHGGRDAGARRPATPR